MKNLEGETVIVHGQEAIVTMVVTIRKRTRLYLDREIKVPGLDNKYDYVDIRDVDRVVVEEA